MAEGAAMGVHSWAGAPTCLWPPTRPKVNGPKIQSFTVTVRSGSWFGENVEDSGEVNVVLDPDALPPVAEEFVGGYPAGDPDPFAKYIAAAFEGKSTCLSRTTKSAEEATPVLLGNFTLPAGTMEWEYVVSGTFPKRVFTKYTSRSVPVILTPKALRFRVATETPDSRSFWVALSLQVFGDGDPMPSPGPFCASADPSAPPAASPGSADAAATPEHDGIARPRLVGFDDQRFAKDPPSAVAWRPRA